MGSMELIYDASEPVVEGHLQDGVTSMMGMSGD